MRRSLRVMSFTPEQVVAKGEEQIFTLFVADLEASITAHRDAIGRSYSHYPPFGGGTARRMSSTISWDDLSSASYWSGVRQRSSVRMREPNCGCFVHQ